MHHSGSEPSLLIDYLDWPVQSPSLLRGNNTEAQVAAPVQSTPVQLTRDEHAGNCPGDTLPRFSAPVPTMSEGTSLFIRNEHAANFPRDALPRFSAPAPVPTMSEGTSLFIRNEHAENYPRDIVPRLVAPALLQLRLMGLPFSHVANTQEFPQNISLLFLQDLLVEAEVIQPLLLVL